MDTSLVSFHWWSPEWIHPLIPQLPSDFPHWTDFWVTIPVAILITLLRFYVCDPIATAIVVNRLKLSKTALRTRNAKETDAKKRIPPWVLAAIDDFAQDMIILKKRLKKKKKTHIEIRLEKQSRWRKFTAGVIETSKNGTKEGGAVTQSQLNGWWGVIKQDAARSLEIQKFNEAFWRFAFYTFIWVYGIWVGYRESWLMDMRAIWGGWPTEQHASAESRWYYFLSFAHYIHLFVTQFFEPKRKDWWEMFIHHIVTMALIFFSYIVNFIRIGVVVLLCHDGSDIFLELAKLFNYLKYGTATDLTFSIFALAFFIGRLVMYPWRVVYVALVFGAEQPGTWFGYRIFVGLLFVLQILHVFWFYTIMVMVYSFVAVGAVEKDVREETESEPEEVTGEEKAAITDASEKHPSEHENVNGHTNGHSNGHTNGLAEGTELKKRKSTQPGETDRVTRSQSRSRD